MRFLKILKNPPSPEIGMLVTGTIAVVLTVDLVARLFGNTRAVDLVARLFGY